MRALLNGPQGLRLGETAEPTPRPNQALIAVKAVSLNFGEVAYRSPRPDFVSGWDAAGIVLRAAADGSGPAEGARVVTFGWSGAWAQRRAVDTGELAIVPDDVDLGVAAALPVAGVTALQAVRRLGSILGRRVLVTGASGGVGRYAVRLAALAGAHVIASVGDPAKAARLGADEIVPGPEALDRPVYGVLDTVGGAQLAEAFYRLEPDGVVQAVGRAARQTTTIDFEEAGTRSARGRIENFNITAPLGDDLAYLLDLVRTGRLTPEIGWRGPWERAEEAAAALLDRRVKGKAVLDLA
ncbi:oxidoreductase [Actinorhabdospora filicis]|uniref:Oxidoreductase n=1 Tax=Actinorhabdospora filicis TaxID=1785913 RepID=A0A9W6SKM7_9ACTN|nr:zinc-binding dehydrogenase [Actinorhabdospora filicis]GLZ77988.1 oxidoreductase [Actinorhabdospora filicis]